MQFEQVTVNMGARGKFSIYNIQHKFSPSENVHY